MGVGRLEEYTAGQEGRVLRAHKGFGTRVWGKEGPGHNGVWKEEGGTRGSLRPWCRAGGEWSWRGLGVPGCR